MYILRLNVRAQEHELPMHLVLSLFSVHPVLHSKQFAAPFTGQPGPVCGCPFSHVHVFTTKRNTQAQNSFFVNVEVIDTYKCTGFCHGTASTRCCTMRISQHRSKDTPRRFGARHNCMCKCSLRKHGASRCANTVPILCARARTNTLCSIVVDCPASVAQRTLSGTLHRTFQAGVCQTIFTCTRVSYGNSIRKGT